MIKETILIIGSAGFLGSNLIRFINYNKSNYSIVSVDRISDPRSLHNVYGNKGHDFYLADAFDSHIMERIYELHKPKYVINLSDKVLENLLALGQEYECKNINVSSFLYGAETKENSDINLKNVNSVQKYKDLCNEALLSVYNSNPYSVCEIFFNTIRAPECFGPRQKHGMIPNLFLKVLNVNGWESCVLKNKGMRVNDLLFAEDLCEAIMLVLEKGQSNEVYNVSSNLDYTEFEIASLIKETLQQLASKSKLKYDIRDITLDGESCTEEPKIIDCKKIKDLGWKPTKKFKERLKYTIVWYMNNKWFFDL